jgi:2-methylisocitrate lyase-like PEP mutase family enzyme
MPRTRFGSTSLPLDGHSHAEPAAPFIAELRSSSHYGVGVGVHSALTACLAERAGFDAVWLSSLEVSSAKALPDVNLITATEVRDILAETRRATTLPIIVDADNGYGSDETAVRAVRDFCAAGASAICIEDNAFPKRNSFYEAADRTLDDVADFCRRIEAVRSCVDGGVEIIARTEGLVAGLGVDGTVERVRRYVDAGADAIFVQTKAATVDQYPLVLEQISHLRPIMSTPTMLPQLTATELHVMGVDIVVFSNVVIRRIVSALEGTLADLRQAERIHAVAGEIAPLRTLFELTDADHWLEHQGQRHLATARLS